MTKVIDSVISIDTFEQQFVVLKGMLQSLRLKYHVHTIGVVLKVMFKSPRLKYHVQTIGIHPSLRNNAIYEHKCIENIKKLYKQTGNCDDQQQTKDIIEASMVSNPEGFTDNSPISTMKSTPFKKPSARKSLLPRTIRRERKESWS